MNKLLITEITRMGPAFCVIGLQREDGKIRSVRPVTSTANSWLHFPYHRGDVLQCDLAPFSGAKPHIEDRVSARGFQKESAVPEPQIVAFLRKAEIAGSLPDLFGCALHENRKAADCMRYLSNQYAPFAAQRPKIFDSSSAQTNFAQLSFFLPVRSCAIFPSSTVIGATSSMPPWMNAGARIASAASIVS
jgi:hypothetical protein